VAIATTREKTPDKGPVDLIELTPDRKLRVNFHAAQRKAWRSKKRIVAIIAGSQSGKTTAGPVWLYREIQRRGPGDYLVVSPSYKLMARKALPSFRRYFEDLLGLGTYHAGAAEFRFSEEGMLRTFGEPEEGQAHEPTTVFFGHAQDPESLESATAKAAWLDEAGQKGFKLESWEAILRRLSLFRGRVLITTTPYNLGWLKQKIWDRWKAGDEDIEVVNFPSTANPLFPPEEAERARRDLPYWKYAMFYLGLFTRPAGLIYDSFDEGQHKVPRFAIPDFWPRYLGLDFGGVNTAGLFYAEEPGTKRLYLYREYHAGKKTAAEHAKALLAGEPMVPTCVGGSRGEGQWRQEFRAGGLPVREPPISDVEVGIDRVYGTHKRGEILVFDDLSGYLEEKMTYSRKLDENGEPAEEIEDKSSMHRMDAERYVISYLKHEGGPVGPDMAAAVGPFARGVGVAADEPYGGAGAEVFDFSEDEW
jgi:hypothetical protein